jgi:aldose 1-epimerase
LPVRLAPLPPIFPTRPPAADREPAVLPDGTSIDRVTLRNGALRATLIGLGATLISLDWIRPDGSAQGVTLGFDDLHRYRLAHPYLGSTIGRVANRIREARFELAGRSYALEPNDEPHHLHGGWHGFHAQYFTAETFISDQEAGVAFSRVSPDGEAGYPGRLEVRVIYRLEPADVLRIDFVARTDRETVVNMTHHGYFNLKDAGASDVLGHELWVAADHYLPIDAAGIPTGDVLPVAGSVFDFRSTRALGGGIASLPERGGYDHCFLLSGNGREPRLAAILHEPTSSLGLEVRTTQPALQLYTGNFLDGSLVGRRGQRYGRHAGVCLETQHPVDAPNQPAFASTRLLPDERYAHSVIYRLGRVEPG